MAKNMASRRSAASAAGGADTATDLASADAPSSAAHAAQGGARIRVAGVGHTYGGFANQRVVALQNVDIDVAENEFVSILGPSGCGKSTLLRIIAGLVKNEEGTVTFYQGDSEVASLPGGEIGFVFQDAVLLPWKNVWDNVIFPLQILGDLNPETEARAKHLLQLAGLAGFEHALPKELSGGMRQRVSIVRALAHDPQVLLMDEPFGALDALTRDKLNIELLRIWEERPKTILFVTHSIEEAVLLSDRVVTMSERPGTFIDFLDIELERPRHIDMRDLPAFREYVRHLRRLLG